MLVFVGSVRKLVCDGKFWGLTENVCVLIENVHVVMVNGCVLFVFVVVY